MKLEKVRKNHWRLLVMGVAVAIALSAGIIFVMSTALRNVADAVEEFGFYSFREIHTTLLDVTRLSDALMLATQANDAQQSLDHLAKTNDFAYIRFVAEDRSDLIAVIPAYRDIEKDMRAVVDDIDAALAKGLPFDVEEIEHIQAHTLEALFEINEIYYVHGASINDEVGEVDRRLGSLSTEVSVILGLFSALSIVMVILLIKRHEAATLLRHQATHDALTGLKNRAWLGKHNEQMFDAAHVNGQSLLLFLIDLDHFKQVNDTYGHHVGDALLVHVAEILLLLSEEDKIVPIRLGGDEMAILARMTDDEDTAQLLEKVQQSLNKSAEIAGHQLRLGASIGVATYPEHGVELETLTRNADIALYKAKEGGRARTITYNPSTMDGIERKGTLHTKVTAAIANGEFELYWQPIFNLRDASLSGAEALLRWNDSETGEVLMPDEFIPLAEQSDVIFDIDRMVLAKACAAAARWEVELASEFIISVNISANHLQSEDFPDYVAKVARRAHLNPQHLEIDIKESVFVSDRNQAFKTVRRLRELGFRVALDDFGKGMADLQYLAELDVDRLKIDGSFIKDIETSEKKQALVQSIIAAGRCANAQIVAEGVELQEQMSFLMESGCDFAQGFLFAEPADSKTFRAYLRRNIGGTNLSDTKQVEAA